MKKKNVQDVYMSNHIKYRLIDVLSRPAHHIDLIYYVYRSIYMNLWIRQKKKTCMYKEKHKRENLNNNKKYKNKYCRHFSFISLDSTSSYDCVCVCVYCVLLNEMMMMCISSQVLIQKRKHFKEQKKKLTNGTRQKTLFDYIYLLLFL